MGNTIHSMEYQILLARVCSWTKLYHLVRKTKKQNQFNWTPFLLSHLVIQLNLVWHHSPDDGGLPCVIDDVNLVLMRRWWWSLDQSWNPPLIQSSTHLLTKAIFTNKCKLHKSRWLQSKYIHRLWNAKEFKEIEIWIKIEGRPHTAVHLWLIAYDLNKLLAEWRARQAPDYS